MCESREHATFARLDSRSGLASVAAFEATVLDCAAAVTVFSPRFICIIEQHLQPQLVNIKCIFFSLFDETVRRDAIRLRVCFL